MPLIVHQLCLELDESQDVLRTRLAARLRLPEDAIRAYGVLRRSLDARTRRGLQFVYSVEVALADGPRAERRCVGRLQGRNVAFLETPAPPDLEPGDQPLAQQPVVVGFGPAGMFAAYRLAQYGYRPVVLERGREVRARHRDVMQKFYKEGRFDPESNLLFGEGGAGTYSDGKLYTRVNHPYVREVLEILFEHGAGPEILVDAKPHIGSDRLPNICMRLRHHIERLGGEVRFEQRLDDLLLDTDGAVRGLHSAGQALAADCVVLAIGHSARDTLRTLAERGVQLVAKPFQLGVRIEHPQALVDRWRYRQFVGREGLPPADYQLVAKGVVPRGGDMFSFCMCPGGLILPTHEAPGLISTNGASRAARGGDLANSGFVITVDPATFADDPLAGLAYQEKWERLAFAATGGGYAVPCQRAEDYLAGRSSSGELVTSYPLGGCWTPIRDVVPQDVADSLRGALIVLGERLPGFAGGEAVITAPETRASAPLRIPRHDDSRQSVSTPGLYPVGEGAGYAGGIISAAIDGLKSAACIIRRHTALK